MLKDPKYQERACAALPALCEIETLRNKLLTEDLVSRIVDLCRKADKKGLMAIRTLSYLAQRFDAISSVLSRQSDFIKEILVMLKDNSNTLENTLSGKCGIELVKRLKTLIKRRDFFVTPAAVATLCEICRSKQLRAEAIRSNILVTLIDLFEFDKQGLSGGPRGLIKLAEFEDMREELAKGPHITRLVAFSKDKVVEKSNEATEELTKLSEHAKLRKQIIEKGGVDSIVDNLAKPDHALFAADALLTLMKYDDAKEQILKTKVDLYLLQMIEERIFDRKIPQDGIAILKEIFENDDLRSMMLTPNSPPSLNNGSWNFGGKDTPRRLLRKAANYVWEKTMHRQAKDTEYQRNIIGILHKMIKATRCSCIQNSAINYLRIITDHPDAREKMTGVGIMVPLLWCLKATDVDIQALNDVLAKIASDDLLRREIVENHKILAEVLSSPYPVEALRMTATLETLLSHEEIRQEVQKMGEYKNLKKDPLHYLDPHHHPHEHDLYTSASQAIESVIWALDTYDKMPRADSFQYLDPYEFPEEIQWYMI
ncbi:hypothetical protein BDR07DRAFT_350028 [Suillus spraguei]|nr:hypothetical protein BDR07DRAFT_350028 [Suillus spraguei]